MQRKHESNQQQTGIFRRIYHFISNTFFPPVVKTVTTGHSVKPDSDDQMLYQDQPSNLQESAIVTSPEIVVEFRHDIDSNKKKDDDESSKLDIIKPHGVEEPKDGKKIEANMTIRDRGKQPNKTVTIKENADEYSKASRDKQQQQQQKKDKNISVSNNEGHLSKKRKVPRLLSVDTNINEKSAAFIRSKKAAMEKDL